MTRKTTKRRYRLIRDDSCHWYVISVEQEQEFEAWISFHETADYTVPWAGADFDSMRVDGPHRVTFGDWSES